MSEIEPPRAGVVLTDEDADYWSARETTVGSMRFKRCKHCGFDTDVIELRDYGHRHSDDCELNGGDSSDEA